MGKFKVFDTIDRLMKLYEADETPADPNAENPEEAGQTEDPASQEGVQEPIDATEPQPDEAVQSTPSDSVSDEEKEEYAKMMINATKVDLAKMALDALMTPPPPADRIPSGLMTPTPDNVEAVLKALKGLISIERPLSLSDEAPGENLANALKDTSSGSL